ncbi:hypothetical protein BZL39_G01570 [Zygosaccharomyces parabailii]|nr:hypothetical protein BZL39_G01570 [Zygosaccharomyces parabailii]CDH13837.1 uncharacterized protein ZBAI_05623 [Zygosaccharomyces bailii ISA1307]SJM87583.1 uncharacterized protein ZBIST_3772 [Zygosaccharomyces bailii]
MEQDPETIETTRSQVCDRCRKLKRKCYGAGVRCNNCLMADRECTTEHLLKRKRRSKPTKLSPLEIENIRLRQRLRELEDKLTYIRTSYILSPLFLKQDEDPCFKGDLFDASLEPFHL